MHVTPIFTPVMATIPETLEHAPFLIDMFPLEKLNQPAIKKAVGMIRSPPVGLLTYLLWSKQFLSHSGTIEGLLARGDLLDFGARRVLDLSIQTNKTAHVNGQLIALCIQDDSCFHATTQMIYDARLIGFRTLEHVHALVGWNLVYFRKYLSERRFSELDMIWAHCNLTEDLFELMREQI